MVSRTDGLTTFALGVELEMLTCYERTCGIQFAAPSAWLKERRRDHKGFHCPNGHSQHFPGKTREEELRDELNRTKDALDYQRQRGNRLEDDKTRLKHQVRAHKGVVTRLKNKAIAGICAFCSCEFPNVAEHVKAEHPGEALEEAPE